MTNVLKWLTPGQCCHLKASCPSSCTIKPCGYLCSFLMQLCCSFPCKLFFCKGSRLWQLWGSTNKSCVLFGRSVKLGMSEIFVRSICQVGAWQKFDANKLFLYSCPLVTEKPKYRCSFQVRHAKNIFFSYKCI